MLSQISQRTNVLFYNFEIKEAVLYNNTTDEKLISHFLPTNIKSFSDPAFSATKTTRKLTTKFPEQRIKYEMNVTFLKNLDHLFVWRSPAEITIMAVARFCWPDVAIYEDNCNVLVIMAVQFSTGF